MGASDSKPDDLTPGIRVTVTRVTALASLRVC